MKKLVVVLALGLAAAAATAGERLFSIDCNGEMKAYDVKGSGTFKGVLPRPMTENAAGWSTCGLTSAAREENGVRFVQLAQAIEGRAFARREDAGRNGQKFVFSGRGGDVAVYVDLSEDEVRDLAKRARLVDLWGNPVSASRNPGSTLVYEIIE